MQTVAVLLPSTILSRFLSMSAITLLLSKTRAVVKIETSGLVEDINVVVKIRQIIKK